MEADDLFWYRRVGPIAGSSSDLNQAGMRTGGPQRRRKPRCASFLKRGAGMKSLPALPGADAASDADPNPLKRMLCGHL